MGQRIYQNDHYGKNGDVFRGYANEKGVFNKEKPLPQGTYFYIIQFKNGNQKNKAGYLLVNNIFLIKKGGQQFIHLFLQKTRFCSQT